MGTSTTVAGWIRTFGRLAAAVGIVAGLLLGQAAFSDAPQASAKTALDAAMDDIEELKKLT